MERSGEEFERLREAEERIRVLEAENDYLREREAALLKFVERISEIVKYDDRER